MGSAIDAPYLAQLGLLRVEHKALGTASSHSNHYSSRSHAPPSCTQYQLREPEPVRAARTLFSSDAVEADGRLGSIALSPSLHDDIHLSCCSLANGSSAPPRNSELAPDKVRSAQTPGTACSPACTYDHPRAFTETTQGTPSGRCSADGVASAHADAHACTHACTRACEHSAAHAWPHPVSHADLDVHSHAPSHAHSHDETALSTARTAWAAEVASCHKELAFIKTTHSKQLQAMEERLARERRRRKECAAALAVAQAAHAAKQGAATEAMEQSEAEAVHTLERLRAEYREQMQMLRTLLEAESGRLNAARREVIEVSAAAAQERLVSRSEMGQCQMEAARQLQQLRASADEALQAAAERESQLLLTLDERRLRCEHEHDCEAQRRLESAASTLVAQIARDRLAHQAELRAANEHARACERALQNCRLANSSLKEQLSICEQELARARETAHQQARAQAALRAQAARAPGRQPQQRPQQQQQQSQQHDTARRAAHPATHRPTHHAKASHTPRARSRSHHSASDGVSGSSEITCAHAASVAAARGGSRGHEAWGRGSARA